MMITPFPCSSIPALAHATSPQCQRSASSLEAAFNFSCMRLAPA
jgi:hypothetical protein